MGQLKKAVEEQGLAPTSSGNKTIADVFRSQWSKIEAVMPKHLSSERLFQLAVSTVNHDPKLAECNIATLLSCVMKCSALGLEPSSVDGLGRAYILPYRNNKTKCMEATFILGYKGMLDLARRSGEIKDISARAVYEGDEFEYEFGLNETCRHIPLATERTPDKLTHVYMVCHFKDGGHYLDVMTKAEVDAIRSRSKAKDSGSWVTDYEAMAKKSVIRRGFPYLPVAIEAQQAVSADETTGGFDDVIPVFDMPQEGFEATVEESVTTESNTESGKVEATLETPSEKRRAVCKTCGNTVSDVAEDAMLEDLNSFLCCDKPDYEWA